MSDTNVAVQSTRTPAIKTSKATTAKRKVIDAKEYARICNFIRHYHGLPIDCELEMVHGYFSNINRLALKSILQTELNNRQSAYNNPARIARKCLKAFEEQAPTHAAPTLLIKMAVMEHTNPAGLCRAILQEKYKLEHKSQLARLMKYPHLIEDAKLSANVIQCLCSDSQDGPLIDLRRRLVGEEYEFKLKQLAKAAGMHYHDENELRRLGYDKTPDIKMLVPFLYKGEVVNWIESKATFGDVKTHQGYIQQQLYSYCNRFGTGIVIYWFGYQEETTQLPENSVGITVLHDFPDRKHIEFLNLVPAKENRQDIESTNNFKNFKISENFSDAK